MSEAAKRLIETLQVKGSKGELLRAIADHIPEGHTTTPPMTTEELATPTQQSEKTVRRNRDALVRLGVIRVLDGGRGIVARYEILHLAGERPVTAAPLPLLGRPKPRPAKKVRKTLVTMTNLFDETSVKVTNVRDNWRSRIVNVGQNVRRWFANVGQSDQRLLPPWLRLARARTRYTQDQDQEPHTPAVAPPIADAPTASPPSPMPAVRRRRVCCPAHAWCEGRVHVPRQLHQEHLRKWNRLPGESDSDREDRIVAVYATCLTAIPDEQNITDADEFTFWRRVIAEYWASTAALPKARAPTRETRAPIPENDLFARAKEERRRRYGGT